LNAFIFLTILQNIMDIINNIYEKDFYAWLTENAKLLRQGRLSEIDIEHIAEELEGMSRSEKRRLINRLAVLLAHLLKWQFQAKKRNHSWKFTIIEQRNAVADLLEDSPSLKHELDEKFKKVYEKAVLQAVKETGIKKKRFPTDCPFSFEQTMDDTFFPKS